jgi:signal transduction histidine kinase
MSEESAALRVPRRLLVVDEDRDFAGTLGELLGPLGYSVKVACSVNEALEALAGFAAEIALVDVKLGLDDGAPAIPRLKSRKPELVCLAVTASASLDSVVASLGSGAQDYVIKPLEPAFLAKKLEQALARGELQQREAREQRLLAMGSLCSGVAHDLNNYLQVMVAELGTLKHVLRTRLPDATHVLAGLDALDYAVNGATSVCRQIRTFAKGSPPGAGSDASEVLRSLTPALQELFPAGVSLHVRAPGAPVHVGFDAKQLEQVLRNLLVNARHALNGRGNVWVELSLQAEPTAALLKVTDDGCGMASDVLPRIFDPYFSTKPPKEGVGLGLSVVYGMVRAAGGSVRVESQVGHGSCFHVTLPLKGA